MYHTSESHISPMWCKVNILLCPFSLPSFVYWFGTISISISWSLTRVLPTPLVTEIVRFSHVNVATTQIWWTLTYRTICHWYIVWWWVSTRHWTRVCNTIDSIDKKTQQLVCCYCLEMSEFQHPLSVIFQC